MKISILRRGVLPILLLSFLVLQAPLSGRQRGLAQPAEQAYTQLVTQKQQPAQRSQSAQRPQRPHPTEQELEKMSEQYGKLTDFYRIMVGNYLDTMNYQALVERGITSMLAELDPHSIYLTASEQQTSNEELGGGFSGIGIEFNTLNDTIIVVNTVAGGPAERVGLLPNDRIVGINNQAVIGMSRSDVPRHLRGPKGTRVDVTVFRRGTPNLLDFTMVRDDIPLNTIDAAYMPDPRTGYIKVNRFGATTGREFSEAFNGFSQDIDALILDLRGNGGGFLPEAIRMSSFFLDDGQRVVSTEGNMYPTQTYDSEADGRFNRGRLIVLVDEISASASEIVAGAVQDWDRGILIGNTTFGKGLVQREFPLEDGSAVRLTIAKYLTPTGRAIQRPYESGNSEQYYRDAVERSNSERYAAAGDNGGQQRENETSADTTNGATPRNNTRADTRNNNQNAARNNTRNNNQNNSQNAARIARNGGQPTQDQYKTLRSGRTVYGSDGIRPDVIMPADTTGYSPYWSRLVRSGQIHEFVQDYLDGERANIAAQYPYIEDYLRDFDAAQLLPGLTTYAQIHGKIEPDPEGLEISKMWLAGQLKALIAQRLWDTTGYYRVSHATTDRTFERARSMLARWRELPWEPGEAVTDDLIRQLAR